MSHERKLPRKDSNDRFLNFFFFFYFTISFVSLHRNYSILNNTIDDKFYFYIQSTQLFVERGNTNFTI